MSYYLHIDGVAYDRALVRKAEALIQGKGDGRISEADIQALYEAARDAQRITDVERRTLHYLRSQFRFTKKAAEWLQNTLPLSRDFDEKIEEILRNKLQFNGLRWVIEEAEAERQAALGNQQDFFEALEAAVNAIFYEAESSTSLRDVIYLETGTDYEDIEAIRAIAREWINSGTLHLVPLDWEQQAKLGTWKLPMPFYEPDLNELWVFLLEMPSRTRYLFTGVVRRQGFEQAYSAGFLPDTLDDGQWASRIVEEEFQFTGLQYGFDLEETQRQSALGGRVKKFPDALRQALVSFIQDFETPSSLLNILGGVYHDEIAPEQFPYLGAYQEAVMAKAREVMKTGTLHLIPLNIKELSEEELGGLHAPEDGEAPAENWIFQLRLPLSDHLYWAVVPRNGERQAYNYGFN